MLTALPNSSFCLGKKDQWSKVLVMSCTVAVHWPCNSFRISCPAVRLGLASLESQDQSLPAGSRDLSLNLWVPTVAIVDSTCLGAPLGVSDKRVAELILGDVVIGGQAIVFTTCSGLATRKLHCLPTCLGRVCAFFSCPD